MGKAPIGVFDSGVGGLTVLRELRVRLPQEDFLYVADQVHAPYGHRELAQVREFGFGIASFLMDRGAKLIVIACNAISAAALQPLRAAHPQIPFVGMEPAVKPAAEESRSGVIGIIATEATFQGELFAGAVSRYGRGVKVITRTIPGLVERIEAGETEGLELEAFLRERLQPLILEGIDELVLGCTHYPLVTGALQNVFGPGVKIVDPSPAVARQTARLLDAHGLRAAGGTGRTAFFTSGSPESFARIERKLFEEKPSIRKLIWVADGDGERLALDGEE